MNKKFEGQKNPLDATMMSLMIGKEVFEALGDPVLRLYYLAFAKSILVSLASGKFEITLNCIREVLTISRQEIMINDVLANMPEQKKNAVEDMEEGFKLLEKYTKVWEKEKSKIEKGE